MDLPLNADRTQRTLMVVAVLGKDDLTDEQLNAGTFGYVLQGDSPEDLMRTVADLRSGRRPSTDARRVIVQLRPECAAARDHRLSPRELDVLRALVHGLSYKMIAAELHISFETVRTHMKCIYLKMNVNNNTAAVAKAIHEGIFAA
ncbi:MAG: response regulator transcription factor [Flavobacteriales bacterium]|nr:response regulator transcription factor [Flavobacteriales bacterium]